MRPPASASAVNRSPSPAPSAATRPSPHVANAFQPATLAATVQPFPTGGAYAYSQGLECAVERGWVRDAASAGAWILGLLGHSIRHLDLPVFARLYQAWNTADPDTARRWNAWLYASREAAELQREDRHLGTALARLLTDLGIAEAEPWRNAPGVFRHPIQLGDGQMEYSAAGGHHRLRLGLD